MELIKITRNIEKAKSIISMTKLLEVRIKIQDKKIMSSLIITDYYEIIKELITAILLTDGYKTLSHKDLVEYISKNYKEFNTQEIKVLDELRILRNRVAYEGFNIPNNYLGRNEKIFNEMIIN